MKRHKLPPKWKPSLLTVGTAVLSTAVTFSIWSSPTAILSGLMLISHEYGHYFAGHFGGAKVSSPFFIPLGFATLGATRIKSPKPEAEARIAVSGAVYGSLAAGLAAGLMVISGHSYAVPAIAALLVYEIGWGFLGGDGKKFRQARRGV